MQGAKSAVAPAGEAGRIAAVASYDVLDTPPEPAFDDIANVAAALCNAPMALVTVVDDHRQWFKARFGVGMTETPRDVAFCTHAVSQSEPLVVTDARLDSRFADNPLVAGSLGLRFYAGVQITSPDGHHLGTVCVLDTEPRPEGVTSVQITALRALAARVVSELELRRALRERDALAERLATEIDERARAASALEVTESRLRHFADADVVGIVYGDAHAGVRNANDAFLAMIGYSREEMEEGELSWTAITPPEWLALDVQQLEAAKSTGFCNTYEKEYFRKDGSRVPVLVGYTLDEETRRDAVVFVIDISERKRVEAALRESEARFRHMADNAPVMVWVTEPDGQTSFLSKTWYEFTGQTPETGLGRSWVSALHPDDVKRVGAAFTENAGKQRAFDIEFRIRRRDGEWRCVLDNARPRFADDGAFLGYVGSVLDITERRQAADAVRRSEERLRAIVDETPECVKIVSADGLLVHMNPAGLRMIEADSLEAAIGADVAMLVAPEHRRLWRTTHRRVIGGEIAQWQFDLISPSGVRRHMESHSVPFRLPDGALAHLGLTRDVTASRRSEKALQASEERLRMITSSSGIGTYDADGSGVAECSAIYYMHYGLSPDSQPLAFTDWLALIHPDDRARVEAESRRAAVSGGRLELDFRIVRADSGEVRWLANRGEVQLDAEGRAVRSYGAQWDITERKQAETELRTLQESSARVARLGAMGAMASTLAHELNQPLAAVSNLLAAVRIRLGSGQSETVEAIVDALTMAEEQALRAGEIIRRMRNFTLKGEIDLRNERLDDVLHIACENVRTRSSAAGVSFIKNFAADAPRVCIDRVQIGQVVENLLRNAIEALQGAAEPQIEIGSRAYPDRIEVRVSDNGPGIAAEAFETLFQPFVTSKEAGLGLGLPICRTIVEAHGGSLWAEQPAGGGALFAFTLPLARH